MRPADLRRWLDPTMLASVAVLSLRGGGATLQVLMNAVLGRSLGAEGLGLFYLFTAWTRFLGTASALGLPTYALREVSALADAGRAGAARRLVWRSIGRSLVAGVPLCLGVGLASGVLAAALLGSPSLDYVLRFAALNAVLYMCLRVGLDALKGRGASGSAVGLEFCVFPAGLTALFVVLRESAARAEPRQAFVAHFAISAIVLGILAWCWRPRRDTTRVPRNPPSTAQPGSLVAFWLLGLLSMGFSTLPLLLLPQIAGPEEIGRFGVAYRLVAAATAILGALSAVFAPRFARHHARGDAAALAVDLRRSQIYSVAAYLPFVLVFTLFGEAVLRLFGSEFGAAKVLLWIMALGQVVNAATGLVGFLVNMSGEERSGVWIEAFSLLTMTVLMLALGRTFGIVGFAWGYAGGFAVRSLAFYAAARRALRRLAAVAG